MAWTDELKATAIKSYLAASPTPETSIEILTEIAEELEQSANGVRMILVKAGVYIKKDPAAATKSGAAKDGGTRVSKEAQIESLKSVIKDNGLTADDEILDKLTGKAATYFAMIIAQAVAADE